MLLPITPVPIKPTFVSPGAFVVFVTVGFLPISLYFAQKFSSTLLYLYVKAFWLARPSRLPLSVKKYEKGINFLYAVQPNGNFLHWKGGFA
ncbi:sulfate adenylyltransferase subunit 2 [Paenibacillus amylolyticus]|uniref:Sulfate adenylyltransferase subunit 2 n=1 Tax=Paenibacillus amylolyticus TaxID=1451 RepID=A0A100VS52_PAEAM|nr:sulfate adenylyltransferase subunit 2 [Paenibacillus amylolyticus]